MYLRSIDTFGNSDTFSDIKHDTFSVTFFVGIGNLVKFWISESESIAFQVNLFQGDKPQNSTLIRFDVLRLAW